MNKMSFLDCVDIVGSSVKEYDGIRKYVSTGALNFDHIEADAVEEYSFSEKPSRANLEVDEGSLLFAKMQGTQKTLVIDKENQHNIYSTGFAAVKPKNNIISARCLYYLVTSDDFLKQKDLNCSGATQKAITNEGLKKIAVSIPDLCDQAKIAGILDQVDELIKMLHRNSSLLDDIVKSRFVEMFGDPVRNEKGWNKMPIEEVCQSIADCPHSTPNYTNEDTGYMCIRTSIIKKNRILWDEVEFISEEEYIQRIQRKKPEKGDVIYTREGAILGIAAIIDRDYKVALGQRSMLLSPNRKYCTPEFLSVAMNFDSFLESALKGMSGSASPHINVGDIKAFKMIMPPIESQESFSDFMQQTDKSKHFDDLEVVA